MTVSLVALTQGANVPSSRFRVRQYHPDFKAVGLEVTELTARWNAYPPAPKWRRPLWFAGAWLDAGVRVLEASVRGDVCLLQRNLIATLATWESAIRVPLVFDVDDAIFLQSRSEAANRIARRSALVICGNAFLAEHFSKLARVEILPTAVDTEYFRPALALADEPLTIGWSGSSAGFQYLYSIRTALGRVLQERPRARLCIVADRRPNLPELPQSRLDFIPWSADVEVRAIQGFAVGIMPLDDTPWSRGKCSFKMLTYMSVGVPVVVSPVGMNAEILNMGSCGFGPRCEDDWVQALTSILDSSSDARRMGRTGRAIVEARFARNIVGPRLAKLLIDES